MPSVCAPAVQKVGELVENRPSSSTGSANDDTSGIKTCITLVEKKARNLEKRKGKLDDYKQRIGKGQELIKDQKDALEKYEGVVQNLEFAHELQKQFQSMAVDAEKQARKQARREKSQRHQENVSRMAELLRVQSILSYLSEATLQNILQQDGNSSVSLTPDDVTEFKKFKEDTELPALNDERYEEKLQKSAERFLSYLEEENISDSSEGKGPANLKSIISQMMSSQYFTKSQASPDAEEKLDVISAEEEHKGSWADQVDAEVDSKVEDKTDKAEKHSETADSSAEATANTCSIPEDCSKNVQTPVTKNGQTPITSTTSTVPQLHSMPAISDAAVVQVLQYAPSVESRHITDISQFAQRTPMTMTAAQHHQQVVPSVAQHIPSADAQMLSLSVSVMGNERQGPSIIQQLIHNTVPPRPKVKDVRDIVSAIQGNYDFLQDSVIDTTENPNDDSSFPCVRTDVIPNQATFNQIAKSTVPQTCLPPVHYPQGGAYVSASYPAPGTMAGVPAYYPVVSVPHTLPMTTGYMMGTYNSSLIAGPGFIPPITTSQQGAQFYSNQAANFNGASHPITSQPVMYMQTGEFHNQVQATAPVATAAPDSVGQAPEVNSAPHTEAELDNNAQMGSQFTMNPNASEFKSKLNSPEASESGDGAAALADVAPVNNMQKNQEVNNSQSNPRGNGNFGRFGPNRGYNRDRPFNNNSRGRGGYQRYRNDRQQEGFEDGHRNNFRGGWNENRRNGGGRGGPRGRGGEYGAGGYRQNVRSQDQQQQQKAPTS